MIITTLNAEEEEVVSQRFKKQARDKCRAKLEELVKCTKPRTFTMFWECKKQNDELAECLAPFTTEAQLLIERHKELDKKKDFFKSKGQYPPEI